MATRAGGATTEDRAGAAVPAPPAARRRRPRLRRGPVVIGEPAPRIDVLLAAGDPYRPDTVADGGEALGLIVRAASVRGLTKRYAGGPRQDDLCLRVHRPSRTLVVAVADGVSGAARSDVGAALAVRHAVAAAVRQLDAGAIELDFDDLFGQAAWALVEEQRRASGDQGAGVDETAAALSTTLLVAAITCPSPTDDAETQAQAQAAAAAADAAAADAAADDDDDDDEHEDGDSEVDAPPAATAQLAAVGDSPAILLSRGEFRSLVGDPQLAGGLVAGAVQSLPRAARTSCAASCELHPREVLLLCTDGLAMPLADGRGEVGRTLARELAHAPDVIDFARLLDFSRATYDDDRTLVAVWWMGTPDL